jgi:non-specific serine/threonine protein kinase
VQFGSQIEGFGAAATVPSGRARRVCGALAALFHASPVVRLRSNHSMSVPRPDHDARTSMRMFGRLQLLRLLGKSERTMAWLAVERDGAERMLVLPRSQPREAALLEQWTQAVRRAARLSHPQLTPVIGVGVQDGWPFVMHDLRGRATLADRLPRDGWPGAEAALLALQALRGLAYAHDAGVAHHDLQPWLLLVDDQGMLGVAGFAVGRPLDAADEGNGTGTLHALDAPGRRAQRSAAERDVLSFGVLMHALLTGAMPLDANDAGRVVASLPPLGRDLVRLPWSSARPIADALRAIVNRATDRQERQRYHNARTFARALEGWLQAESAQSGGVLALLGDRLRASGVLPSSPGAAARVARLALMERERTSVLSEVVLEDLALAFELLRSVNSAQVRGALVAGNGPVLTVRRAIAMLGLEGVRRCALALRPWPGPLDGAGAEQLARLMERCRRAGRVALALRPPGYDGEVAYLVTLLQALGWLVVQYHFADETRQIDRLMQPAPAAREGETSELGMGEEAAAYAVLGVDIESIGSAVARGWGLGDGMQLMIRRLPRATPVREPESDDELLRTLGSCAHEAVEALSAPVPAAALEKVARRYGRALGLRPRDLQDALYGGTEGPISQPGLTAAMPLEALDGRVGACSAAGPVRPDVR